jgi:hypothetical protein
MKEHIKKLRRDYTGEPLVKRTMLLLSYSLTLKLKMFKGISESAILLKKSANY